MGTIRAKIASGALGVGDRAPSIRGCARSLGVSPSTVVEAYDRLEAEGVIQGRRGSGFYVARADAQPLIIAPIEETRERDLDPSGFRNSRSTPIRRSLRRVADGFRPTGCRIWR